MTYKKSIPVRKRYALWKAHGGKCCYCGELLRYAEVWVDHILPESLLNEPQQLCSLLDGYGLEQNFDINDYGNWVPTHGRCNLRKGTIIFEPGTALFYISIARSKAGSAKLIEERSMSSLKADRLLGSLHIALDEGLISKSDIQHIVSDSLVIKKEPTVITFGLLIETVFDSKQLPNYVPTDYPRLCDWLESDLIRQLQSIITCGFSYTEASLRTGESLSVRLAFVDLDQYELENFSSPWWELLEFAPYSSIYPESQ